ncbi:MAG TPA: TfoX/Sxy family protein [Thermomicrobiales bacterium]|nr:TfoX/Sxy family protein [Thermomicrobiales bacterium]
MSHGNDIGTRKMFGEYGVDCGEVFVGVICDAKFYLKITDAGREMLSNAGRRDRPTEVRNRIW